MKLFIKLLTSNYPLLVIISALTSVCFAADSNYENIKQHQKQRVLVLNSYNHGYKWSDNIFRGIRDTFKDSPNIVTHIEYMDTKIIDTSEYFALLKQLYKNKYANYTIDVIISSDDNALKFLRKYRDELFPEVPVVFCGVNNFNEKKVAGFGNYTGVNAKSDFIANFELILKLHPRIEKLYVINDNITTARSLQTEFYEALKEYEDKFDLEILSDFSLQTLIRKVSSLEQNSVIYYLSFFKDNTGRSFAPAEVIPYISKASPVPMYGSTDYMLGHGIVGGMLKSGYFQGESAANAAKQILRGVSAEKIPILLNNPNTYEFDYRQLQRFGINLSDLPKERVIINRPEV